MSYFAETRVLKVDPRAPDPEKIKQAAALLLAGWLVAFPTETVYGLGANALNAEAIDRIYRAKQRPAGDPMIAHIHDLSQLARLAIQIPDAAYALAHRFWPGPLTLVLRRAPDVPANIASGKETVAVRMPSHPVAVALLKAAEVPVAAPSANTFSRPSATTAAHVLADLGGRVDLVLDGGPTQIGLESTVVDLTGERLRVLRPGGLVLQELQAIIPDVILAPRYAVSDRSTISPGQMLKHYAPRAQVILFEGTREVVLTAMAVAVQQHQASGKRVGLLVADEDAVYFEPSGKTPAVIATLGPYQDLKTICHNLFAGLRELDASEVEVILTRDFGRQGLGAAVWDRLVRAAEGHIITVD